MPDLVREVRRRLAEAADPARAPAMQAYMKSALPFYGVSAVPLRRICRSVYEAHPLGSRAEWEAVVRRMWDDATHREERYAAMALTRHRHYRAFQDPDTLPLYRHLVVTGAWWDLVDPVAAHNVGPVLVAFPDAVTPVVRGWATDDDLWVRRTALLCQLGRKTDLDTALLAAAIEANLEGTPYGREFFIRKAIGWALRQYAYTDPGWVRGFVAGHEDRLSGLSRREALKHVG